MATAILTVNDRHYADLDRCLASFSPHVDARDEIVVDSARQLPAGRETATNVAGPASTSARRRVQIA